MNQIEIKIRNVRNIKQADLTLPFENGIYGLVGANGCGKSTIMECLSMLLPRARFKKMYGTSEISSVQFAVDGSTFTWSFHDDASVYTTDKYHQYKGMYEGSLFYGTRFEDSMKIEGLIAKNQLADDMLADADVAVKERISYILHGTTDHYSSLVRIRNKEVAEQIKVNNRPYFIKIGDKLISQYRMSSGECLLISLMHFLYNAIERRSLPVDEKALVLIDELELALHPIAVVRLLDYLKQLTTEHDNLVVLLSSHSPEVIKGLSPNNLFNITNTDGIVSADSGCYPSYLIRDLYSSISPDFLLLVEDTLAQQFINSILLRYNLQLGKLVHTIPVGGWSNVLVLHQELYQKKILGTSTKIVSILDGDVKDEIKKGQRRLPHLFLPIQSIEKFLYSIIIKNSNPQLKKAINDNFFIVDSLSNLVAQYNESILKGQKDSDKGFYQFLIKHLNAVGTEEAVFIKGLCDEIINQTDVSKFVDSLRKTISAQ